MVNSRTNRSDDFGKSAAVVSGDGVVVEVLLPLALEGPYSYIASEQLVPGQAVRVPLGPREVTGVIWPDSAERTKLDPSRLRPITSVIEARPLPNDLIAFVNWVAERIVKNPICKILSGIK